MMSPRCPDGTVVDVAAPGMSTNVRELVSCKPLSLTTFTAVIEPALPETTARAVATAAAPTSATASEITRARRDRLRLIVPPRGSLCVRATTTNHTHPTPTQRFGRLRTFPGLPARSDHVGTGGAVFSGELEAMPSADSDEPRKIIGKE